VAIILFGDLWVSKQSSVADLIMSQAENADRKLEKLDYDQRVQDYESHGMSDREAERRAFEGQYLGFPR
jgi:hypothetical protein